MDSPLDQRTWIWQFVVLALLPESILSIKKYQLYLCSIRRSCSGTTGFLRPHRVGRARTPRADVEGIDYNDLGLASKLGLWQSIALSSSMGESATSAIIDSFLEWSLEFGGVVDRRFQRSRLEPPNVKVGTNPWKKNVFVLILSW